MKALILTSVFVMCGLVAFAQREHSPSDIKKKGKPRKETKGTSVAILSIEGVVGKTIIADRIRPTPSPRKPEMLS